MKDRGKSVESEQDYNYFSPPCKKHPSNSSSVGICAFCLKDKLMKLVCSDCGEQRLSSCSCSDVSSYRNSSCTVDVTSVGRVSFQIEKLKAMKQVKNSETEGVLLKRSNSCVLEVKKSNGFWRIGKIFKKKREKGCFSERNRGGFDSDYVIDVSRSRSLLDHEVNSMACSSAKVSDFNESEPRKSGFRGVLMDFESDFSVIDDDEDEGFIDLKLELSEKSKTEQSVLINDGIGSSSSSCRITVNERGIKKGKNSHGKVWKWIFKHHSENKDLNQIFES